MKSVLVFKTLAVACALLAGSLGQAAELVKLRVNVQTIIDCVPVIVAIRQGYFAQEGLEVDTSTSAGGAVGIPGLIGGAYDIAQSNTVSGLLAFNQGLDVQAIAPGAKMQPQAPTTEMVGRKGEVFKTAADLEGKSIGVNNRNGIVWLYARAWVKARGGDPSRVSFREVPFPQMEDAVKRRNVDVAFMVEPFKSAALKGADLAVVGSPFNEVQPGTDAGQYLTTGKYAAQNPENVRKFARALRRGVEWYNANLQTAAAQQIVSDFTKLPVAVLKAITLPPMPTQIEVAQIRKTAELMRDNGMFAQVPDVDRFVNRALAAD
ncbi:MAG: ABC transporter substrate-binding protein [Pseudomonadota bacterium]